LKIQYVGGHHLEKSKNRHISATVLPIAANFGTETHFDPPDCSTRKIPGFCKVQHGGGSHLEKLRNGHISATAGPIAT